MAITPDGSKVYVTNSRGNNLGNSVSVIDTATNTVIATIPTGSGTRPDGIAMSPDGAFAYVTTFVGDLLRIDTATDALATQNPSLTVASTTRLFDIQVSPDGTKAYIAKQSIPAELVVVDLVNWSVLQTVTVPSVGALNNPYGVAVSPDGSKVYFTGDSLAGGGIYVMDTATFVVTGPTLTGDLPYRIAASPDGSRLYVPNYNSQTLSVIDTATMTVLTSVATPTVGYPSQAIVSPDGQKVYITMEGGEAVAIFDVAAGSFLPSVAMPNTYPYGIVQNASGSKYWVSDMQNRPGYVWTISADVFPQVTTSSVPNGTVGTAYSASITVIGSPTPTVAYTGTLPPGLTFVNGVLSGTPTTAGTYTFTVTATNITSGINPAVGSRSFTVVITAGSSGASSLTLTPGFTVGDLAPNAPVALSGSSLQPNSSWYAEMRSTPVTFASGTTNGSGDFSLGSNLPSTVPAGEHTITLYGTAPDGSQWTRVLYITVNSASRVSYMSTVRPESSLAATGVDAAQLGGLAAAGLAFAGLGALLVLRRRRTV